MSFVATPRRVAALALGLSPGAAAVARAADASPGPAVPDGYLVDSQALVGPTWVLVGRIDPERNPATDPSYVSAVPEQPATLHFPGDGTLTGTTGCNVFASTSDLAPERDGPTVEGAITFAQLDDMTCDEPLGAQDRALVDLLAGVGGASLTTAGFDTLAMHLTDANLDAGLLAHYLAWPGITRLVLRDRSGEGTLIYAPTAGPGPGPSLSPVSLPSFVAGPAPLVGTTWLLVGWVDDDGRYQMADLGAGAWLLVSRGDGVRIWRGHSGCISLSGTWTRGPAREGSATRRIDLVVHGTDEQPPCPSALQSQDASVRDHLARASAYTVAVQGADSLAPGLTPDDVDPELWAHLASAPDRNRLILRDASGEATLIYEPISAPPAAG